MCALLCFHLSSFLLMWICYRWQVALVINLILAIFLYLFVKNGLAIYNDLYVPDESAISGKFENFGNA